MAEELCTFSTEKVLGCHGSARAILDMSRGCWSRGCWSCGFCRHFQCVITAIVLNLINNTNVFPYPVCFVLQLTLAFTENYVRQAVT